MFSTRLRSPRSASGHWICRMCRKQKKEPTSTVRSTHCFRKLFPNPDLARYSTRSRPFNRSQFSCRFVTAGELFLTAFIRSGSIRTFELRGEPALLPALPESSASAMYRPVYAAHCSHRHGGWSGWRLSDLGISQVIVIQNDPTATLADLYDPLMMPAQL
jgi:hypothetical protein